MGALLQCIGATFCCIGATICNLCGGGGGFIRLCFEGISHGAHRLKVGCTQGYHTLSEKCCPPDHHDDQIALEVQMGGEIHDHA